MQRAEGRGQEGPRRRALGGLSLRSQGSIALPGSACDKAEYCQPGSPDPWGPGVTGAQQHIVPVADL